MADTDYDALPQSEAFSAHLIAGAVAGIAEHSIMYPVDSIKTRMQVLFPSPQAVYTSITNAVSRISSTEGIKILWRGMTSVILGAGPAHALYFGTYEKCKSTFGQRISNPTVAAAGAGACATIASDALMNPFDVVKQRMQVHGSVYRSPIDCLTRALRTEGIGAFYISYPTTLMMTVPFQSIQFATYETFRKALNPRGDYNPITHVLAGGAAGALAAAATNPLDVIKTVLQTRGTSPQQIASVQGMRDAMRLIYSQHALKGFTKGIGPRVLSHMPSTAICWSVYEYFKYLLYKETPEAKTTALPPSASI